mgnify:CR=1 FL=1
MASKYVVYHLSPICVCDSISDAEEMILSIAEEGAYENFCEVMYQSWYKSYSSKRPIFDLVSYFVNKNYWNQKMHSRFSTNANLLFGGAAAWRIKEVIDYSEGDN